LRNWGSKEEEEVMAGRRQQGREGARRRQEEGGRMKRTLCSSLSCNGNDEKSWSSSAIFSLFNCTKKIIIKKEER